MVMLIIVCVGARRSWCFCGEKKGHWEMEFPPKQICYTDGLLVRLMYNYIEREACHCTHTICQYSTLTITVSTLDGVAESGSSCVTWHLFSAAASPVPLRLAKRTAKLSPLSKLQSTSPFHHPIYPTTNGRSRSSQRANCLSLAPPALSSLLFTLFNLLPKQPVLHSSLHHAHPLLELSGAFDRRLLPQFSRRVSPATKTRRIRTTCLPRRSSRRRRSSSAAPATV